MGNETKKYIVTGGPGCGKTKTIRLISELGYQVVPEAPRMVLQKTPHLRGKELQEAIMEIQSQLESILTEGIAFLDRGLVDCEAYSKHFSGNLDGTSYERRLKEAEYQKTVFCLEPLPRELYQNDSERKESYEEAIKIYELLKSTYAARGFNVISVPFLTPTERAEKIILYAVGGK